MTENTENTLESPTTPGPYAGLRKPLFALGALIVLMLVFGQLLPRLFPAHHVETAKNEPAARERIDQLEARIKALEDAPKPSADTNVNDEKIAALQAKLDELQQKIEHPAVSAADSQRTAQLEETVAALKTQIDTMQARQNNQLAALAAFGTLKDRIMRGEPFTNELTQLAQLAQGNAKAVELISELAHDDGQGAPILAGLQSGFEAAIPKALAETHTGTMAHELQSLIRIRKVGEQPGTDDEAILARAETKLNRGEVDAATKELAALSAPAAKAMTPWLKQAEAFISTRHTLDALQLSLVEDKAKAPPVPDNADKP